MIIIIITIFTIAAITRPSAFSTASFATDWFPRPASRYVCVRAGLMAPKAQPAQVVAPAAAPAPPAPALAGQPAPAEPAFQLVPSKRGGDKLFHQGYLYTLRYTAKNGDRSWCCEKGREVCGAQAKTRFEGLRTVVEQIGAHTHLPNPEKGVKEQVLAKARAAAAQQPDTTAATGVEDGALPAVPSTQNLKRVCWRARASEQQKRLKNGAPAPEDVDYSSLATLTVVESLKQVDGEDFLMYDDGPGAGDKRIQMWACQKNLDFLAKSEL